MLRINGSIRSAATAFNAIYYLIYIQSFFANNGKQVIYLYLFTLFSTLVQQFTIFIAFQFHGGFISFYLCQYIAFLNVITYVFLPACYHTLSHSIAQAGH